jgi:hypothetical protein
MKRVMNAVKPVMNAVKRVMNKETEITRPRVHF